jgi:hypothetical protein
MNIIQPLPGQFPQGDPQKPEEKQEQADPLNELNPITLLKKPGILWVMQMNSNRLFLP